MNEEKINSPSASKYKLTTSLLIGFKTIPPSPKHPPPFPVLNGRSPKGYYNQTLHSRKSHPM